MARVLLGVSGGIAAYKAVELVRLATRAGHSVRVVQTPREPRVRGPRHVRRRHRRPGARRRVRARPGPRRLPGRPGARPRSDLPSRARDPRRRDVHRAGLGQHHRQARRRPRRQPPHERRAGRDLPARRRAGDERPDVRAPGHAREPGDALGSRRARGSAGHRPARLAAGSGGWGGWPSRPRSSPPWNGRWRPATRRARSTGCACSSPPAAPASRSTRSGTSATARRAGWASAWPRRPPAAAPRSRWWPPTSRSNARTRSSTSTWRPPRSSRKPWCAPPPRRTWC